MDERREGTKSSAESAVEQTKAFLRDTNRFAERLGPHRPAGSYREALLQISTSLEHILRHLAFPDLSAHVYTLAMERDCFEDIEMFLDTIEDCEVALLT